MKYCLYKYNRYRNYCPKLEDPIKELIRELHVIVQRQDKDLEFMKGKIVCVLGLEYTHRNPLTANLPIQELLMQARAVFFLYRSRLLLLKSIGLLCQVSKNSLESRIGFVREGLQLSRELQVEKSTRFYQGLLRELQEEASNKFVFLSNCVANPYNKTSSLLKTSLNLRHLLFEPLKKMNKNVIVQFDNFSEEVLHQLLSNGLGCKLCVIDMPNSKMDELDIDLSIILGNRTADNPSLRDDLEEFKPNVSILFFFGELSDRSFLQISDKCNVPYSLYFEFEDRIKDPLDYLNITLIDAYKYDFLVRFTSCLLSNLTVEESVEKASKQTLEHLERLTADWHFIREEIRDRRLGKKGFVRYSVNVWQYFKGAVKIYKAREEVLGFNIKEGALEEVESPFSSRPMYHIHRLPVQRDGYTLELFYRLQQSSFINVYGKKGSGKASFIKQFVNQVYAKNLFKDGVYLFDIKTYGEEHTDGNVRDLMKTQFGSEFERDAQEYFRGKDMLIVFEKFHWISEKQKLIFPLHLIKMLQKNGIKVILTSTNQIKNTEHIGYLEYLKINRLEIDQTLLIFLYSQDNVYLEYNQPLFDQLKTSKFIKDSKGIPASIYRKSWEFLSKEIGYIKVSEQQPKAKSWKKAANERCPSEGREKEGMEESKQVLKRTNSMDFEGSEEHSLNDMTLGLSDVSESQPMLGVQVAVRRRKLSKEVPKGKRGANTNRNKNNK